VADLPALTDEIHRDPDLARLRAIAADRLADDPAHDVHHALRVALFTTRFAPAVDRRLCIAAALLHDIVNVPKTSPDRARASELSAAAARPLLIEARFAAADLDLVCDAIRDHSFSRGAIPVSDLGCALQDADRLESLGAIGAIRTFVTGARMDSAPFDPVDPFARDRPLDDRRYSVDHFYAKLLGLAATMRTAAGRAEAVRRTVFMRAFLDELASELGTSAR
jgi:uncharacterized protein